MDNVVDLNEDAGGKYIYLHYQRFSGSAYANFYYLNDFGSSVSTKVTASVSNHLEEMKPPSVPT